MNVYFLLFFLYFKDVSIVILSAYDSHTVELQNYTKNLYDRTSFVSVFS